MDGERPGVGGRLFLTFAGLALTLVKRIFSSFYERVCVCELLLPLFGEQFRVPVSRLISRSPAHENKFGQACPGHGFGFLFCPIFVSTPHTWLQGTVVVP